jgi:DNA polymerase-1
MSKDGKTPKPTPNNLEAVAWRELGIELDKEHQTADWGGELSPAMLGYAATDARVLLPLAAVFESKVTAAGLAKVRDIEHRSLRSTAWMAGAGIPFDAEGWRQHLRHVEIEVNRLDGELSTSARARPGGGAWNWNSPSQVKEAFALLGVALPDTKEETLSRCEHPLAELLLEYRKASKTVSQFGPKLLGFVRGDSRIYPDWRQIGTETGRMSCSRPNAQQLPPEVRRFVRAPEGRALITADYAQAEIRVLAAASGDPTLIEAFRSGRDPYKATAASMFGVPEEEVTDEQRASAKVVNFSFIFGASAHAIAKKLELTEGEGRRLMGRYFAAHPRVGAFLRSTGRKALVTGEARTLTGRARRFGNTRSTGRRDTGKALRGAMNHPMQGGCADGLKLALALLQERRHECPGAVPIIALHDEVVVECDEEDVDAVAAWLVRAMVDGISEVLALGAAGPAGVPVEVEVETGKTWGEGRPWSPPVADLPGTDGLDPALHAVEADPLRVAYYIDYRDLSVDNYPQIFACEGCAQELDGVLGYQDDLTPGEGAQCEVCWAEHRAAAGSPGLG